MLKPLTDPKKETWECGWRNKDYGVGQCTGQGGGVCRWPTDLVGQTGKATRRTVPIGSEILHCGLLHCDTLRIRTLVFGS